MYVTQNHLKAPMLLKRLFILWLLGCLNIFYSGFQIDRYLIKHEPDYIFTYPLTAVLFTCFIFSIYFISQ